MWQQLLESEAAVEEVINKSKRNQVNTTQKELRRLRFCSLFNG